MNNLASVQEMIDDSIAELGSIIHNMKAFSKFVDERQLEPAHQDEEDMKHMLALLPQFCVDVTNAATIIQDFMQLFRAYCKTRDNDIVTLHENTILMANTLREHMDKSKQTYAIIGGSHEDDILGRQNASLTSDSRET